MEEGRPRPSISRRYWSWVWAEIDQAFPISCATRLVSGKIGRTMLLYFVGGYILLTIVLIFYFKPVARLLC